MNNGQKIDFTPLCQGHPQGEGAADATIIVRTAARIANEGRKWTYYNILRVLREESPLH